MDNRVEARTLENRRLVRTAQICALPLVNMSAWFLTVALDQVTFSANFFDLAGLDRRYRRLVRNPVHDAALAAQVDHLGLNASGVRVGLRAGFEGRS